MVTWACFITPLYQSIWREGGLWTYLVETSLNLISAGWQVLVLALDLEILVKNRELFILTAAAIRLNYIIKCDKCPACFVWKYN